MTHAFMKLKSPPPLVPIGQNLAVQISYLSSMMHFKLRYLRLKVGYLLALVCLQCRLLFLQCRILFSKLG